MTSDDKLKLGDYCIDTVTGFKGTLICKTYWLNGCLRVGLQPKGVKDGKPYETQTFDVEQVQLVEAQRAKEPQRQHGGNRDDSVAMRRR